MRKRITGSLRLSAVGIVVWAVVAASLTGCLTTLETSLESRQEYVDTHVLTAEIREAILDGRVTPGMTKEEVDATWGWPSDTDTSETLGLNGEWGKEFWYYTDLFGEVIGEVYFNNGKVESVYPWY